MLNFRQLRLCALKLPATFFSTDLIDRIRAIGKAGGAPLAEQLSITMKLGQTLQDT